MLPSELLSSAHSLRPHRGPVPVGRAAAGVADDYEQPEVVPQLPQT
jgi:hypothetical protein